MIPPYYQTIHCYEECNQDIKLSCPVCHHMNYKHIAYTQIPKTKKVIQCWHCKRVTWIVHVIADLKP